MARTFNGASSDKLTLSTGLTPDVSGAFTWVVLIKQGSAFGALSPIVLAHGSSSSSGFRLAFGSMSSVIANSTYDPASTISLTAGTTYLLAISKASGAVLPRFHAYDFGADSWARSNGSATTSGTTSAVTNVILGMRADGTGAWSGDVAAAAFYGAVLSDDQLSAMPYSFAAWRALAPGSMFLLDQSSTSQAVIDLTGGGANQTALTGTAVSTNSVPTFGYGHPVLLRTKQEYPGPNPASTFFVPSGGSNTNTLTTPSFNVSNGDVIAVKMTTWDTTVSMGSVTGGSQTWTSRVTETPGGFNGWCGITTCTVSGSPGTMTVSATPSAASRHNMVVERWTNAQLATTPVTAAGTATSGAANGSLTTSAANSIVTWCAVDEQSVDPSSRVYLGSAVDEGVDDGHVGSNTVHYFAYQQAPTQGSTSFGLSQPTGQKWVIAGLEIQAAGSGGGSQTGAAALSAASNLTAGATQSASGAVAMTAGSSLTAGATQTQPGAVVMGAGSSLTAAGVDVQPGAASLTAASSLTAAGTRGTTGSATLSAGSSLTAGATQAGAGAAALTAASTLTAAGTDVQPGAATLSAASALTASAASGTAIGATMSAASNLTAAGTPTRPGAATLASASALTAGATQTGMAAAALSAASSLTAGATGIAIGAASLTAASTLTASGSVVPAGGVALAAGSNLTAAAQQSGAAAATLSAASLLSVAGTVTKPGGASLSAASALPASAGGSSGAAVSLTAASALAAGAIGVGSAAVTMNAASVFTAAGSTVPSSAVTMAAISSLTGSGVANQRAAAALVAVSMLTASVSGGQPVRRRPGVLPAGSTRTDPKPGTLPYPRLTAGTLRGPSYTSGG